MKFTVNLYDYAHVRLNEHGQRMWKEHLKHVPEPHYTRMLTRRDGQGRLKLQLHEIMHVFGPESFVGGWLPFESAQIEFEPEPHVAKIW